MLRLAALALCVALCVLLSGCSAIREQTVDYIKDAAIEQISKAIDKKLAERNLSLDELKRVVDTNKDGQVNQAEVFAAVKETAKDYIQMELEKRGTVARGELEEKFKAVASARDFTELKAATDAQDVFGKGTLASLILIAMSYLGKQVFSAKSDGRRDAEIAVTKNDLAAQKQRLSVLEKLTQRDLDGDGSIGDPIEDDA